MIKRTSENWRKSTRSNGQANCVEAANRPGLMLVRDSKLGDDSPILAVTPAAWKAFLASVQ